ncbi:hypothetical protein KQI52_04375 [bacterium]|nr:hypothetical protein [bacterium]
MAGFAVGESLDRQNVTPDTLATDQLKEAVQLGKEVRVSLVSGEILYGKVNQVDEHRVFMNQRETYPWPHGGHVQRNLPLESIVTVERLDYSIRWKIIGAAAGLVVDISLVMFIMAMSSLGSLG